MGLNTRAPTCLFQCYDDTKERMDPYAYWQYKRSQKESFTSMDYLKMVAMCETIAKDESEEQAKIIPRKRGTYEEKEERLYRDEDTGAI